MGKHLWIGLLLWMVAGAAIAVGPKAVRKQIESSLLVTGSIDIETDGHVSAHRLDHSDKLPKGVVALVGKWAPDWKFEPILVNGQPAKARASMRLRIVAKKLDHDRYSVAIRSASFGDSRLGETVTGKEMAPPAFPESAARSGVSGTVYLVLRVGRSGLVEEAVTEQVNLRVVADEGAMERWRRTLARAALGTAKRWVFNPPAAGDEANAEFWSVRVPVDFVLGKRDGPAYGTWEAYVPGPRQAAPWVARDELASSGPDTLASGGVYQVGQGLRLLTPLEGG